MGRCFKTLAVFVENEIMYIYCVISDIAMLRCFLYQPMYLNNFIYIEEYSLPILFIVIVAIVQPITYSILLALCAVLVVFLLISPRSPLMILSCTTAIESLVENQFTTRPSLGSLSLEKTGHLVDGHHRRVFLRGVNVGGKLPLGHTTWDQPPEAGSFVGTLFDLDNIDVHLKRLSSCGFSVLRLNVTWEALEPEVEGIYDKEYISYLLSVVRACDRHDMRVVIDSHQDAWSRWTGGDGAPRWTMERLGMNLGAFPHTRSAMLHCSDLGHLMWFTNYTLYGAGTMFALFFGGKRFAPATKVSGVNVQEWLQSAYIRAWCQVANALVNEPNVIGFEPMNEPNAGWIGISDLHSRPLPGFIGWDLTPWDSIRLANGESLDVAFFPCVNTYRRTERANPDHLSAWKQTYVDVWKDNGVWDGEGLINAGHFALQEGETFESSFLTPFNHRFALAINNYNPRWWVLCFPGLVDISTSVASPHWYDNITLVMNRYIPFLALSDDQSLVYPYIAEWAHRKALKRLLSTGGGPYFLGEVGIPWLGSVGLTAVALESSLSAVDSQFISMTTLWNYNIHNTYAKGDGWNLEDFSIWNSSLAFRMPNAVRPYAMLLAGRPISSKWEPFTKSKTFTICFELTPITCSDLSLIFIPEMHFRSMSLKLWASDGGELTHDWRRQAVYYRHRRDGGSKLKTLRISI